MSRAKANWTAILCIGLGVRVVQMLHWLGGGTLRSLHMTPLNWIGVIAFTTIIVVLSTWKMRRVQNKDQDD